VFNFKNVANDWPQCSHIYQGSTFDDENDKILWTKIVKSAVAITKDKKRLIKALQEKAFLFASPQLLLKTPNTK